MLRSSQARSVVRSSQWATTARVHQLELPSGWKPSALGVAPWQQRQQRQQRQLSVRSLDHLVITCHDMDKTIDFYTRLGMGVVQFGQGRQALEFGSQKINLHQKGKEL